MLCHKLVKIDNTRHDLRHDLINVSNLYIMTNEQSLNKNLKPYRLLAYSGPHMLNQTCMFVASRVASMSNRHTGVQHPYQFVFGDHGTY